MPKLFQITASSNWGAIGRIANQIGEEVISRGWDSYIAYGRYYNPSSSLTIRVGNKYDVYKHFLKHYILDCDGFGSVKPTKALVERIREIAPDIIHLHNIHDHWLNYKVLFDYLASAKIPIVWTQHDCWAFTGGCGHFTVNKCEKWRTECDDCLIKKGLLPIKDYSRYHYHLKDKLFNSISNLTLVPVSYWLEELVRESFLCNNQIKTIYNGIDTDVFRPVESKIKEKLGISNKYLLVAMATAWSKQKGLDDYIKLGEKLPSSTKLLLVGLTEKQRKSIPNKIFSMGRTDSLAELVDIYSGADIVMNLSYEETFGLTTVEGMACGTPGIVYNCTASPELISKETGEIVESGDIDGIIEAIKKLLDRGKNAYKVNCIERANTLFNRKKNYEKYFSLYEKILKE